MKLWYCISDDWEKILNDRKIESYNRVRGWFKFILITVVQ